ncbi:hypothetical protein ACFQ36_17050 [Arthrobacter sp. GCM10027362]|uniref:hypothetical protein n=1 Tax=Arthrobacter sp. GCM10027362 TaxID=3273379 RepID=UPI00362C2A04
MKKKLAILAVVALLLTSCKTEQRAARQSQGWMKTDRGFVWCLYELVTYGSTTDCDWSTLTDVEPDSYVTIGGR